MAVERKHWLLRLRLLLVLKLRLLVLRLLVQKLLVGLLLLHLRLQLLLLLVVQLLHWRIKVRHERREVLDGGGWQLCGASHFAAR